jgi:hypothetical protein
MPSHSSSIAEHTNICCSRTYFSQPFFLILEGYMILRVAGGRTGEFEVRQHSPVQFRWDTVCSARENESSLASNKAEINVFIDTQVNEG